MSKAVLVIDMPDCCKGCMCYVLGASNNFCEITRRVIFDDTTKPSHCPLKHMPVRDDGIYLLEYSNGYQKGWNDCIKYLRGNYD